MNAIQEFVSEAVHAAHASGIERDQIHTVLQQTLILSDDEAKLQSATIIRLAELNGEENSTRSRSISYASLALHNIPNVAVALWRNSHASSATDGPLDYVLPLLTALGTVVLNSRERLSHVDALTIWAFVELNEQHGNTRGGVYNTEHLHSSTHDIAAEYDYAPPNLAAIESGLLDLAAAGCVEKISADLWRLRDRVTFL